MPGIGSWPLSASSASTRPSGNLTGVRQLRGADPRLRVTSAFANSRDMSSVLVGEANEQPDRLLSAADRRREIRSFGRSEVGKGIVVARERPHV